MKQLLNIYLNFYNTIYTPLTNLVACFNQTKLLYLIIKLIPISFIFQLNKSLNFLNRNKNDYNYNPDGLHRNS